LKQLESRALGKPKETIEQVKEERAELQVMRQMTPEARRFSRYGSLFRLWLGSGRDGPHAIVSVRPRVRRAMPDQAPIAATAGLPS
jgi:hypothetical protein